MGGGYDVARRVVARLELRAHAAFVPPGVTRRPPVERRSAHLRRSGGESAAGVRR